MHKRTCVYTDEPEASIRMITSLTGFLMGFIGSMPILGPISSLVFQRGLGGRYWDGWAIGVGGALAEGVYCALAVRGFAAVHQNFHFSATLAKAMAVSLLGAIGLYFIFIGPKRSTDPRALRQDRWSMLSSLMIGFTVAAANPTLLLIWSAAFGMLFAITNVSLHGHATVIFPASVIAGIVTWFSVLLILLHRFRRRFPFFAYRVAIRGMGVALVALAISSAAWTMYSVKGAIP